MQLATKFIFLNLQLVKKTATCKKQLATRIFTSNTQNKFAIRKITFLTRKKELATLKYIFLKSQRTIRNSQLETRKL